MSHVRIFSRLTLVSFVSFAAFACAEAADESKGGPSEKGTEPITEFWSDSSDAIEIDYWEFFGSSVRYRKTRDQLTAEELAILGDIRVIARNSQCVVDGASATISVTTDGKDTLYRARSADAVCSELGPYVGLGSVMAFLEATGCNQAFEAGQNLETAPLIGVDRGCYYPLHDAEGALESWVVVDVAEPGSYEVSFDTCESLGSLEATLLDEGGATELGSATAPAGECPHLTVDISEAGSYALRVATDSSPFGGAIFYLRVDSSR